MLRHFANDATGSIGAVLGLGSLVLLGGVSASLDYSRMTSTRAALGAAADAAALAGAQARVGEQATIARNVFDANFRNASPIASFTTNSFRRGNDEVFRVEAVTTVSMTLSQAVGFTSAPVRAISEVLLGNDQDIQAALVLDVTGSMSGAKLTSLKDAASRMVNTIYDKVVTQDQVRMSVVPFAQYVNVGMANRNQPWISVPADSSTTQQVCWQTRDVTRVYNCRQVPRTGQTCNDGVCTPNTGFNTVCDYDYGPPYQRCQNQTTSVTWRGCVGSRNYPLNVRDNDYIANRVPGIMNVNCSAALTPLSTNRAAVLGAIKSLSASGNTYIPSGLTWGWATLSPGVPFSEPTNAGRQTQRYLVLMTDGENTLSPNYPTHNGNNVTIANNLTRELCTNIKAENITVFSIAFQVTNTTVKTLLQNCATSSDKYFDAVNSQQLSEAFDQIARLMSTLRVVK